MLEAGGSESSRRSSTTLDEADQFLEEHRSAIPTGGPNSNEDDDDDSETLYHGYGRSLQSKTSSSPSTVEDQATAYRRKLKVGLLCLTVSTVYQVVVLKVSAKAAPSLYLSLVPTESLVGTVIVTVAVLSLKSRRASALLRGFTSVCPSAGSSCSSFGEANTGWRDLAVLASLISAANAMNLVQNGMLDAVVSSSTCTYLVPILALLLPLFYTQSETSNNGLIQISAITVPLLYGFTLMEIRTAPIAVILVFVYSVFEAGKLVWMKKLVGQTDGGMPSDHVTCTPRNLSSLATCLPLQALFSGILLLGLLLISATTIDFNGRPASWFLRSVLYLMLSLLNQLTTLWAVSTFNSPTSVAILVIPRGLLVTLVHGGLQAMRQPATQTMILVPLTVTVAVAYMTATRQKASRSATPLHSAVSSRKHSFADAGLADTRDLPRYSSTFSSPNSPTAFECTSTSQCSLHVSSRVTKALAWASFLPIIYWISSQHLSIPSNRLSASYPVTSAATNTETVDVVIATYNEPAENLRAHIDGMKTFPWIMQRSPRFLLYMKGNITDKEAYRREVGADVVIPLVNRGREAGTFLRHILMNYNATMDPSRSLSGTSLGDWLSARRPAGSGLADHTLFMQHHLAWDWIARERMALFRPNTGYLHFAPYLKMDCGKDLNGNGHFPKIAEVYNIFKEEFCPPTLQLGAYAAQFVVSKQRIMKNPYHKYEALDSVLEADAGHWIHEEGSWWKYHGEPGPTNPYLGHALERSWPIIFGCDDPKIKDTCPDDVYSVEGCQCFDA